MLLKILRGVLTNQCSFCDPVGGAPRDVLSHSCRRCDATACMNGHSCRLCCGHSTLNFGAVPISELVDPFLRTSHSVGTYRSFVARVRRCDHERKGISGNKKVCVGGSVVHKRSFHSADSLMTILGPRRDLLDESASYPV